MEETKTSEQPTIEMIQGELKPAAIGTFIAKDTFLDNEQEVIIKGIGSVKQWDKLKYKLFILYDKQDAILDISKKNYNTLLTLLGYNTDEWKDKKVKVHGSLWEGEIEGKQATGTTLHFYR